MKYFILHLISHVRSCMYMCVYLCIYVLPCLVYSIAFSHRSQREFLPRTFKGKQRSIAITELWISNVKQSKQRHPSL